MDPTTAKRLRTFLSNGRNRPLGVDTETNGEDIRDGRGYATGIGIAYLDADGYHREYFPFRHAGPGNLPDTVLYEVKQFLEAAPMVVFHNAKFDLVSLGTLGIDLIGHDWYCTMVIAHLINENWPYAKSLESCSQNYLGEEFSKKKDENLANFIKAFGWGMVPAAMMVDYGSYDAELALRLMERLYPLFMREGLEPYWPHKRKLIETVIAMESRGVLVDTQLCEQQKERARIEMAEASRLLGGLNPRSPKDMKHLFIDTLGLPTINHQKTGKPTFDKYAIAQYEEMLERISSPVANLVKLYRGWGQTASTFYGPYIDHLSPDGALRPSYMHHKDDHGGTVTGRLSCQRPNLQQIPRVSDKPWNGSVKKAFLARPGYTLWEADYSQLELRLGAAYAKEETLLAIFAAGDVDVFTQMSQALGMSRMDTKTLTYSMQYGAGVNRIMNVFGVSETEARRIRENYFSTFPNFRTISDMAQAKAKSQGKIRIWSGRYRHFRDRHAEAHKALNSVIQGGAADIVERRMGAVYDNLDDGVNFRMLLQVHDSVIAEVKNGMEDEVLPEWTRIMEQVEPDFGVRFAVDAHRFGG